MVRQKAEREQIYEIELDHIVVSDDNVRHTQRERDLEELAASIRKHGLLNPVELRGSPMDPPPHELIVGQRRFLAHKNMLAKEDKRWQKIRAVFVGKVNPVQAAIRSLAENMHRAELNHADAAKAINDLYEYYDRDDRKVAAETGLSLRKVRDYIYIQELAPESMRRKLGAGEVTPADVKRALKAAEGNAKAAERLLDMMTEYKMTGYEKKRLVDYAVAHPERLAHPEADVKPVIEVALQPKVEDVVIVPLPDELRDALDHAVEELAMGREEIATQALREWLRAKGFIDG